MVENVGRRGCHDNIASSRPQSRNDGRHLIDNEKSKCLANGLPSNQFPGILSDQITNSQYHSNGSSRPQCQAPTCYDSPPRPGQPVCRAPSYFQKPRDTDDFENEVLI